MQINKAADNPRKWCVYVTLCASLATFPVLALYLDSQSEKAATKPNTTHLYKTIAPNGTVEFSDSPKVDSKPVTFGKQQLNSTHLLGPKPLGQQYQPSLVSQNNNNIIHTLELLSPGNEATIRDNNGSVLIQVILPPALAQKTDLVFTVIVDDKLTFTENKSMFNIENIPRGSHTIFVQAYDKNGKLIAKSLPITFFMHQARVK